MSRKSGLRLGSSESPHTPLVSRDPRVQRGTGSIPPLGLGRGGVGTLDVAFLDDPSDRTERPSGERRDLAPSVIRLQRHLDFMTLEHAQHHPPSRPEGRDMRPERRGALARSASASGARMSGRVGAGICGEGFDVEHPDDLQLRDDAARGEVGRSRPSDRLVSPRRTRASTITSGDGGHGAGRSSPLAHGLPFPAITIGLCSSRRKEVSV